MRISDVDLIAAILWYAFGIFWLFPRKHTSYTRTRIALGAGGVLVGTAFLVPLFRSSVHVLVIIFGITTVGAMMFDLMVDLGFGTGFRSKRLPDIEARIRRVLEKNRKKGRYPDWVVQSVPELLAMPDARRSMASL